MYNERVKSMNSDKEIQRWRFKKMLKSLENIKGDHTSMITLLIRPSTNVADINKLLTDETYFAYSNVQLSEDKTYTTVDILLKTVFLSK